MQQCCQHVTAGRACMLVTCTRLLLMKASFWDRLSNGYDKLRVVPPTVQPLPSCLPTVTGPTAQQAVAATDCVCSWRT